MKNKAAVSLGQRGGQKTVSLHGREHFSRIAKGWPKGKPRKCTHEWVDHWDAKTPELICSKCEETKPKSSVVQ